LSDDDKPPRPDRRRFMAASGLALALPGRARARVLAVDRGERQNLSLWYEQAAGPWVEALPVGCGRLGAMVFGRAAQERVQLNIDTLFGGGPYDPDSPDALQALPRVRALRARGGTELDLAWARGRPWRLALRGQPRQAVRLRLGGHMLPVTLDGDGQAVLHRFPS
jgi:alpha-L-fucosidase 2